MTTTATDFLVGRHDLGRTRLATSPLAAAAEGEIVVSVDRFAFTANNVTYGVFGDAMQYWDFFPAAEGWGRIPVWGFADVVDSRCAGIAVGERLWGYWPMSTHARLLPASVTASSLHEASPHRSHLHAFYNSYTRCAADPAYESSREDQQMLLRVLFFTGFLIEDFLSDQSFFGARSVVIASASSKTALSLAFELKRKRDPVEVVGLTSPGHLAFLEGLGCYDRVLTYDRIASLAATTPTVFVDMAGDGRVLREVHTHFGAHLAHSCMVGATHWTDIAMGQELPGIAPVLFFAPAQVAKRVADWGMAGLQARMAEAWTAFVAPAAGWIRVVRSRGAAAVERVYRETLEGRALPSEGHVLTLHD